MEYPRGAYVLALIGAVFQVLVALAETLGLIAFAAVRPIARVYPYAYHPVYMMARFPLLAGGFFLLLSWIFAAVALFGAFTIRSDPETGGIISVVAAVLSFSTLWGFLAGSVLMLIGGVMAIVYRPAAQSDVKPAPAQPSPAQQ